MAVEFSEYRAPRAVELFSEPLPEHDGLCWPVCGVDGVGMPHGTGATPKRAFLAWGGHGEAPADAVWVKVTDLGGLTDGGGQDAFLWACLYDCRLFLHLGAEAPAPPAVPGAVPESGSGFAGKADDAGMLEGDGVGRHGGPAAYVAALDERDGFLKSTDAGGVTRWRADASWDVLATMCWRTSSTPGPGGVLPHKYATVYAAVAGNVLCFYTSTCESLGDGKNWAAFGSVSCQYGYDPRNEDDGCTAGVQEVLGSVVPVVIGATAALSPMYGIAPLPWQGGGGLAVFEGDAASASMNCGTLNVTHVEGDTGLAFGNASFQPDPGVFFCPRLHFMGVMAPSAEPHAGLSVEHVQAVLYGGASYFPSYGGIYYLPAGGQISSGVPVVPAFNLLFDPWAVEGLGLHKRNTDDFARVDARDYLPPAPGAEWVRVAAATLRGPVGPVYLDIAGADVDGCLLTASGSTEYVS